MRTLTTICVAAAALGYAPAPALADHDTCGTGHAFQTIVPTSYASTGTVDGVDRKDFWRDAAVDSSETLRVVTLQPVTGDADLYVWSDNCATLLCSSVRSLGLPETCSVGPSGAVNVEVRYWSGGSSQYTVTVAHSPAFSPDFL